MYREDLSPRVHFDHPVELNLLDPDQQSVLSGRALNVSPTGMFVCAPVLLPMGTAVMLRFELMPGVLLASDATVVRAVPGDGLEPAGMGLLFDNLDQETAWCLAAYIDRRLQPGSGQPVKLELGDLAAPVNVTSQGAWQGTVSVEAPLPFLKLGSSVKLGEGSVSNDKGQIRWVEVHVCPETGIPRLNIGIDVADSAIDDDEQAPDDAQEPLTFDEDDDPVCTDRYLAYARLRDGAVRHERRESSN